MEDSSLFVIAVVVGLPFALGILGIAFLAIKTKIETGSFCVKRDSE